jgi:hypothetical protein
MVSEVRPGIGRTELPELAKDYLNLIHSRNFY